MLSFFIPKSILLVWPQFYFDGSWLDFDELYGPLADLATRANGGFSNDGESVFDTVAHMPVDFMAKPSVTEFRRIMNLRDRSLESIIMLLAAEAQSGGFSGKLYADHLAHALAVRQHRTSFALRCVI
jgi:hypothetical protein